MSNCIAKKSINLLTHKTLLVQIRNFIISEENESLQRDVSSCETLVESAGNTKFFKKQVEKAGAEVTVVNTVKFKVIMNL